LTVTFLDVGQGDAICVEMPRGEALLVDGGPGGAADTGRRVVVPFLKAIGRSRMETVLLTHAHDDHYGGLGAVVEEFPVQTLTVAAKGDAPAPVRRLLECFRRAGSGMLPVAAGDVLISKGGVRITVLNPGNAPSDGTHKGENNHSVALMIAFGRTKMLLCGDMEQEAEAALCQGGMSLGADVLKVGHHGGETSCTSEFIRRVSPMWAVVSVGRQNRFGHPSSETLARLREAGSIVLRTDLHGAVTFISDGEEWRMKTFR
jgi:competence protein ComEC